MTSVNEADPFEVWLAERPKWLQTVAASLLATQKPPTDKEINILADLCLGEAAKKGGLAFQTVPSGSFAQQLITSTLNIEKLDKVCGVNAIRLDATLNFGNANLSVVYGTNGSGKSGFARLLKHACGARVKSELLRNVFEEITVDTTAEICINHNGEAKKLPWTGGAIPELRHIHVFDTQTAASYINSRNQATYEPRRM